MKLFIIFLYLLTFHEARENLFGGSCIPYQGTLYYLGGYNSTSEVEFQSITNNFVYTLPLVPDPLINSDGVIDWEYSSFPKNVYKSNFAPFLIEEPNQFGLITYDLPSNSIVVQFYNVKTKQIKIIANRTLLKSELGDTTKKEVNPVVSVVKVDEKSGKYIFTISPSYKDHTLNTLIFNFDMETRKFKLLSKISDGVCNHVSFIKDEVLYIVNDRFDINSYSIKGNTTKSISRGIKGSDQVYMGRGARNDNIIYFTVNRKTLDNPVESNYILSLDITTLDWTSHDVDGFSSTIESCFAYFKGTLIQSFGRINSISNKTQIISVNNWKLKKSISPPDNTPPPPNPLYKNNPDSNTPAIVGGAVGGTVLFFLILLLTIFLVRRARKPKSLALPEIILEPVWAETKISSETQPLTFNNHENGIDSDVNNKVPSDFSTSSTLK